LQYTYLEASSNFENNFTLAGPDRAVKLYTMADNYENYNFGLKVFLRI
jgi:hypothetical protein